MRIGSNNSQTHAGVARVRASQLLQCRVSNAWEEDLGVVKDIVLARGNRRIAYVAVAFGAFLGIEEKFFAMPWLMIDISNNQVETRRRINLHVDQDVLKVASGFHNGGWPDQADMTWSPRVDCSSLHREEVSHGDQSSNASRTLRDGSQRGNTFGRDPTSEAFRYRRVSQLLLAGAVNGSLRPLVEVDDLILDGRSGEVERASLSFAS